MTHRNDNPSCPLNDSVRYIKPMYGPSSKCTCDEEGLAASHTTIEQMEQTVRYVDGLDEQQLEG